MPSQIRHPEWRSSLEGTKYPFAPGSTLTNSDGASLPEEGFIDAHLYPIGGKDGIYLSQITINSNYIIFYIGDQENSSIASGSVGMSSLLAAPLDKRGTIIQLSDNYNRPAGILIASAIGIAAFSTLGLGTISFLQAETEFVSTVCMPTPEIGVRGVILEDGSVLPELHTDDLWFVGGDGVILSYELSTAKTKCSSAVSTFPTIRVDVVGDPLALRKLCTTAEGYNTPAFIKTIRVKNTVAGCAAEQEDENGNPTSFFDINLKERDGQVFIQGNDALTTHPALRINTSAEGAIEIAIAGTPNYKV